MIMIPKMFKNMKKNFIWCVVLSTFFVACNSDDDLQTPAETINEEIKIIASLPQNETRSTTRATYTDDSDGSTYSVKAEWESGDKVRYALYDNGTTSTLRKSTKALTISGGVGTFTLANRPKNNSYFYCHHPASADYVGTLNDDATCSTCSFNPPSNQNYIFATIDAAKMKSNFLIGCLFWDRGDSGTASDMEMEFKNTYALLKISVKLPYDKTTNPVSKIKNVVIKGWDGSEATNVKYGGTVTMTGSTGAIVWSGMTNGQYESGIDLGLASPSGGYREGVFYALVTPQTFSGFYLEVKDQQDTPVTYTYETTGDVELQAGYMYGIKAKLTKVE